MICFVSGVWPASPTPPGMDRHHIDVGSQTEAHHKAKADGNDGKYTSSCDGKKSIP